MQNAQELFEHELRDLYDAENKLVNATQTMAEEVEDSQLSASFMEHHEETKNQVKRLETVFESIGRSPRREKCPGINGLIEEFTEFVKDDPAPEVLNFFAVTAAMKVEHYEILAYKSLIALAGELGIDAGPLEENLAEEEQTSNKLESVLTDFAGRLPVSANTSS